MSMGGGKACVCGAVGGIRNLHTLHPLHTCNSLYFHPFEKGYFDGFKRAAQNDSILFHIGLMKQSEKCKKILSGFTCIVGQVSKRILVSILHEYQGSCLSNLAHGNYFLIIPTVLRH